MELAAHWHRCQNLPKERVNTSLLYRERDDPVKDESANWRTRSGFVLSDGPRSLLVIVIARICKPSVARCDNVAMPLLVYLI